MQTYGQRAEIVKAKRRFHALRYAIAVHLIDAWADVPFTSLATIHGKFGYFVMTSERFQILLREQRAAPVEFCIVDRNIAEDIAHSPTIMCSARLCEVKVANARVRWFPSFSAAHN